MTQPAIAQTTQPQTQPKPTPNPSPYNVWRTSEKYLISSILALGSSGKGRKAFAEAVDTTGIQAVDFFSEELKVIWHVMGRLYRGGSEINLSTIWAESQKSDKALKHINLDMLVYLANETASGHITHADNVVDASISSAIRSALTGLQPLIDDKKTRASEKLREVHKIVTDLANRTEHASKSKTIEIADGLQSYFDSYQQDAMSNKIDFGIPSGFPQFDQFTDGWQDSTLNVVAGPPGSGKTVFLMTSALHSMMHGKRTLIVQLELKPEESYRRLLCAFAGIDSKRLKRHNLAGWEQSRLPKAMSKLKEYTQDKRFTLLTMNQPTLDEIKIKLDTLMIDGYDIIFFDYAGGAKIARANPRMDDLEHHRQIYNAVDGWKTDYNVPIVAGAQYGHRTPQKHPGGYTQDMIYSSAFIKHNAHTITFLHPVKASDDDSTAGEKMQFAIAKNRDGEKPLGTNLIVNAKAQMNMFRFVDEKTSPSALPDPLWEIHERNQPRKDEDILL